MTSAFNVTIRPDYLAICDGDHCAAAILDLFDRWTHSKLKQKAETWIYKTRTEMRDDLLGLFGLSKVADALIKLRRWGYLLHRPNPRNPQDRTFQYQFNSAVVDECLGLLSQVSEIKTEALRDWNEGLEGLKIISQALKPTPSLNPSSPSLITSGLQAEDDDLPYLQFFRGVIGEYPKASERDELRRYYRDLGHDAYRDMMARCESYNARTWGYILQAFRNLSPLEAQVTHVVKESRAPAKELDDTPNPLVPPPPFPPEMPALDDDTQPIIVNPDDVPTGDDTTEPDITPHEAWDEAYQQLEIQLDQASFDTWVRGCYLIGVEGQTYTIAARSQHIADMLQHRLYRDVQRIVGETVGAPVQLAFTVQPVERDAPDERPLYQKLAVAGAVCRNGVWS